MNFSRPLCPRVSHTSDEKLVIDNFKLKTYSKQKLLDIINKLDKEISTLQNKTEHESELIRNKSKEITELQEQLETIKQANKLLSYELLDAHQAKSAYKKKLDEALNTRNAKETEEVLRFHQRNEKGLLEEELTNYKSKTSELTNQIASLQEEIRKYKFYNESLDLEISTLKDDFKKKKNTFKEALKVSQIKNYKKNGEITVLQSQVQNLKIQIAMMEEKFQANLEKTYEECKILRGELEKSKQKLLNPEQIEANSELIETLTSEREDLKLKYIRSVLKNNKLIKKIVDLKQKQTAIQQGHLKINTLNLHPESNSIESKQSINSTWVVKVQLKKIYNYFFAEIKRSMDGDKSFYSLESKHYANIENQLNELISLLHESFEAYQDSAATKYQQDASGKIPSTGKKDPVMSKNSYNDQNKKNINLCR